MNAGKLEHGDVVEGPFWSHSPLARGVGIVTKPGREIWTRVAKPYIAVRVVVGDCTSGGYAPGSLRYTDRLRPWR